MSRSAHDAEFLREVILRTTKPIVTVDGRDRVVFVNDAAERLVGRDRAGLVDTPAADLFEDGSDAITRARTSDPADGPPGVAATLGAADGGSVPVTVSASDTEWEGERYSTLTIARRESATADREPTERLVRQLFDHRQVPLFVFDAFEPSVVTCNREARRLVGESAGDTPAVRDLTADPEAFTAFLADVAETTEGDRAEFTWRPADGEPRPVEVVASPIELDGRLLVLADVQDVSDRVRVRADRRRRTAALDLVDDGIAIVDENLEHTYANDRYAAEFGYDSPDDLGGTPLDEVVADAERFERVVRETEGGGRWTGTVACHTASGGPVRADVAGVPLDDGSLVVAVRGVSERPRGDGAAVEESPGWEPGTRLSGLTETRGRLAAASDPEEVAEIAVESLTDVFGHDLGCIRTASGDGSLDVAAITPRARELVGGNPGFEFAVSEAGRAFRTGDPVVEPARSGTAVSDLLTARAHYPLGDHGVLSVATTDGERLTDDELNKLRFLAGGVAATLDRIERRRRLQSRCAELRDRRDHLETTVDTTAGVQEAIRELLDADTDDEINDLLPGTLASLSAFEGAWIAELDLGDRLQVSGHAGVPDAVLSAVDGTPVSELTDRSPEELAEKPAEPIALDVPSGPDGDRTDAGDAVAVPVASGDRIFGVVAVHVPPEATLGPDAERSLAVLGDAVGVAFSSFEHERLLLSDETVQLEFRVTDPDCLSVALSAELDTHVAMKRTVRNAHDEHLSYVHVSDTDAEAALAAAASIDAVHDCRLINDYEDDCLIELTRPNSGDEIVMEYGATMRTAEADSGEGTLVLEAPNTVNVRRLAEAYRTYNPESELLSKRKVDRPVRTARQLRTDIKNTLTEKQFSAVTSAFYSGYYEWPRESTAEEVAASMEITASTLHQHLRRANKKILTALLENATGMEGV